MAIDIILFILLLLAVWKGYNRGLIVAVFSFFAILIGLAAAIKLSVFVAKWLSKWIHLQQQWLPILAFVITMVGVIILVRIAATALQKIVNLVLLGWVDKLGGIVLYACCYFLFFSIIIFYASSMHLLDSEIIKGSKTFAYISPFGPKAIHLLGFIIPFFKNILQELEQYFGAVFHK